MFRSRCRRLPAVFAFLVATVPIIVSPAVAAGTTTDGSAFGVEADVTLVASAPVVVGPVPQAQQTISTTVPSTDTATLASLSAPPVVTTGLLTATTTGDPLVNTSTSSAQIAGLNVISGLVTADAVSSDCLTTSNSASGSTTLVDATAGLPALPRIELEASPLPNTTIDLDVLGTTVATLVLNEQTTQVVGNTIQITVNAIHLHLIGGVLGSLGTGDVVVGQSFCQARNVGVPSVTSISPNSGPTIGGTPVTVTGTNVVGATQVTVDGAPVPFTITSPTTIDIVTPPHAAGTVHVQVTGPSGASALTPADEFSYLPAPSVTGLNPTSGPEAGGTLVTITGTGLTGTTGVSFGGNPASGVTVVDDTTVTAVSPAGTGSVPVTVTTPGGTSPVTPAGTFSYVPAAPTIATLSPDEGLETGGTTVTVTGTGFVPGATVTIGGDTVPTVVGNSTSLTFVTPAHAPGAVTVTVTTPSGTTAPLPFTYLAVPTVTGLAPDNGPTTGGTVVTVTGTGLDGVTAVDFGGTAGTIDTQTATSLTVTTPAHAAGPFPVTLTGPEDVQVAAGTFTFTEPPGAGPNITSLTPDSGPEAGGTVVTITGTGFTGATAVAFGEDAATSFTVVADTTITATSPPGTGAVTVSVTTPSGTSPVSAGSTFSYVPAAPTITDLDPSSGPTSGGTVVTVTGTGFTPDAVVTIGGDPATTTFVNGTTVTFVTPPGTAGAAPVAVTTSGGTSNTLEFTYLDLPTVTNLTPTSGPTSGGTVVTITGTGLDNVTAVSFGGTAGTIDTATAASLTVTTPAHAAGPFPVTLTGPGSAQTPAGTFTFVAPAPTITDITPDSGPQAGGTPETITGTGFTGATSVTIGGTAVPFTVVDDSTITTVSPASPTAGDAPVVVTTPGGSAQTTFTYVATPTLTGLNPNSGPTAGGTAVTISGSGFTGATSVHFGGVPASSFTVVDDATITAVSPPHAAGSVGVVVTTPGGSTPNTGPNVFTYLAVPAIAAVVPNHGPTAGGTRVTIVGSGFTSITGVTFGGVDARSFVVNSPTQITAVTPTHAVGPVSVIVSGVGGDSNPRLYTYQTAPPFGHAPVITGLFPDHGPTRGGTRVTILGQFFTPGTQVSFGGRPGTHVETSLGGVRLTVVTPAHSAGLVNVVVTNASGSTTRRDGFRYIGRRPPHHHHHHHHGKGHHHHGHHHGKGDSEAAWSHGGPHGGRHHGPLAYTGYDPKNGLGVGGLALMAGLLLTFVGRRRRASRNA